MLATSLGTLIAIVLGIIMWQANARARELANRIVKRACQQHQVQWLDESTTLTAWRLRRNAMSSLGIWREFEFEFLDNDTRLKGTLTLLHGAVIDLQLPIEQTKTNTRQESANERSNVIPFPTRPSRPTQQDS